MSCHTVRHTKNGPFYSVEVEVGVEVLVCVLELVLLEVEVDVVAEVGALVGASVGLHSGEQRRGHSPRILFLLQRLRCVLSSE